VTTHFSFRDLPAAEKKTTATDAKSGVDSGVR
jgi:hypothetical protein